jgi:hypothetical protein
MSYQETESEATHDRIGFSSDRRSSARVVKAAAV